MTFEENDDNEKIFLKKPIVKRISRENTICKEDFLEANPETNFHNLYISVQKQAEEVHEELVLEIIPHQHVPNKSEGEDHVEPRSESNSREPEISGYIHICKEDFLQANQETNSDELCIIWNKQTDRYGSLLEEFFEVPNKSEGEDHVEPRSESNSREPGFATRPLRMENNDIPISSAQDSFFNDNKPLSLLEISGNIHICKEDFLQANQETNSDELCIIWNKQTDKYRSLLEEFFEDSASSLREDQSSKQETCGTKKRRPGSPTHHFSNRVKWYPKDEFQLLSGEDNWIGCGGFANVRKYRHKDKIVAIKEFSVKGDDATISKICNMVQHEANTWCRFQHENIVEFLGIIQLSNGVGIIMEYVDGGNLSSFLHDGKQSELSWNTRLGIAKEIASGLDYLHNYAEKKAFCHGDVKPDNVLLTKALQVKLADFGSATFYYATGASTTTVDNFSSKQFTLLYVAPEFLQDNTQAKNPAMDMYSFGIVLYVLISRKYPYSDIGMPNILPALILGKVKPSMKLIDNAESQLQTNDDRAAFSFLMKLMQRCWNNDPESRPSSKSVKMELGSFITSQQQSSSFSVQKPQNVGDEAASNEENSIDVSLEKLFKQTIQMKESGTIEMQVGRFLSYLREYSSDQFEVLDVIIDSGSFADVWKCYHKELKLVAIKQFAIIVLTRISNNMIAALHEVNILRHFQHPNIAECLGVTQLPNAVGIIMEYVDGGNLHELLSRNVKSDLSWEPRLHIALETIAALFYLHNYEEQKAFCHGDLNPKNILLTKELVVKLIGFGPSALQHSSGAPHTAPNFVPTKQFSLVYMAPEYLEEPSRGKNPAMDMYSFGMILYQMICRRPPYSDSFIHKFVPGLILDRIKPSGKLIDEAESQLESEKDRKIFQVLKNLMERCWNNDPDSRPSSKTVEMELKDFLSKLLPISTSSKDGTEQLADEAASGIKQSVASPLISLDKPSRRAKSQLLTTNYGTKISELSFQLREYLCEEFEENSDENNLLGRGGFAEVRKYHHNDLKVVAIKRFIVSRRKIDKIWNRIKAQVNILCRFHHPNIVEFFGITKWPNAVGLIMEYVDGGNLRELLSGCNQSDFLWENRMRIAQGIISALSFIHNNADDRKLCHGNIKPENVLLTQNLVVKLADFGLAWATRTTMTVTISSEFLPTKHITEYVAPEFFKDLTQHQTPAMDIYSFGTVLHELICTKAPYHDYAASLLLNLIREGLKPDMKLIDQTGKDLQTDSDRSAFDFLKELMLRCWNDDPASRPSSKTIEDEIKSFLTKQQNPGFSGHEAEEVVDEVASNTLAFVADAKATAVGIAVHATEKESDAIDRETSSVIGPNGGVIKGGGCRLVIPNGALDSEVKIELKSTYGGNEVAEGLITVLLRCEPRGLKFKKKVLLRLYTCYVIDEPAVVQVRRSEDRNHWEIIKQLPHTDENYFEFSIKGFSWFAAWLKNLSDWWNTEKRKSLIYWISLGCHARNTKVLRCFVEDDVPGMKKKPTNPEEEWELPFFVMNTEKEVTISLKSVNSSTTDEDSKQGSDIKINPPSRRVVIDRRTHNETSFELRWINNKNDANNEMIVYVQTTEEAYDQPFFITPPDSGALPEGHQQTENLRAESKYISNFYGPTLASVGDQSSVNASSNDAPPQESHQEPEAENQSAPLPETLR